VVWSEIRGGRTNHVFWKNRGFEGLLSGCGEQIIPNPQSPQAGLIIADRRMHLNSSFPRFELPRGDLTTHLAIRSSRSNAFDRPALSTLA
jgi:hypothetical protein